MTKIRAVSERIALKRVVQVMPSNVDKHSVEGEQPVRLCNYVDVYKNDRVTNDIDYMHATASDAQVERFTLRAQDVVITKDSEEPTDIGVPAFVPVDMPGVVCGYHLAVLRPDLAKLHGGFLAWWLRSAEVHAYFSTAATGISRYALSVNDIGMTPVYRPSLGEQQRIADFLDEQTARIDALIAEKERLLATLAELRYSTVSWAVTGGHQGDSGAMNTGNMFVPKLPPGWSLGGLTKYIGPVVDYRGKTPEKVPDGVLLVTARNIRNGALDYSASAEFVREEDYDEIMRRGTPRIGDVLFTTEAPLGQVANIDREDIALAQRVVKFCGLDGLLDNYFLKYWLMGDAVQSTLKTLATGSTAEGIKASKFGQIPVAVPPISEQRKIVLFLDERLSAIDAMSGHTGAHIDRLHEYRSSLISAAVTGQLDINAYQTPKASEHEVA